MRYHPHTRRDIEQMLEVIGAPDVPSLFRSIPEALKLGRPLAIAEAPSEDGLLAELESFAKRPPVASFLGAGAYRHFVPSVVDSILQRSEFLTSYTPYQPELAQGTLQAMFEFQTMVSELFGLPVANASLYDGASALAEAVLMCLRQKSGTHKIVLARSLHPEYRDVVEAYVSSLDVTLVDVPFGPSGQLDLAALARSLSGDVAAVVVQSPNFLGGLEDQKAIADLCHGAGAHVINVVTDTMVLGLLEAPGHLGADVVVGEGASMVGGPMFGGPAVGLFATREEFLRQVPGRLSGEARDKDGRRGYVLTLSTREQHIRREKATSNICTNQGLVALGYSIHLALRGPEGLRELAEHNLSLGHDLEARLAKRGVRRLFGGPYFNELAVSVPNAAHKVHAATQHGVVAGYLLERKYPELQNGVLLAVNELHTPAELEQLVEVLT